MKAASIYATGRGFLVHAQCCTTDGVWIFAEPLEHVPADADAAVIGRAARRALGRSRSDVPHPSDWTAFGRALNRALKDAAGIATWAALVKRARLCSVSQEGGSLTMTPTRNGGYTGPERGYHDLPVSRAQLSVDEPDHAMGEAVLRAFSLCE